MWSIIGKTFCPNKQKSSLYDYAFILISQKQHIPPLFWKYELIEYFK